MTAEQLVQKYLDETISEDGLFTENKPDASVMIKDVMKIVPKGSLSKKSPKTWPPELERTGSSAYMEPGGFYQGVA